MDLLIYLLIPISGISSYLFFVIYRRMLALKSALEKKDEEIKSLLKSLQETPKNPSLELTEFLKDQSRYGYSFVRVDPQSVLVRSPRERDYE